MKRIKAYLKLFFNWLFAERIPDRELKRLFEQAARSLLGQQVIVRFVDPQGGRQFIGFGYRDSHGNIRFDISPRLGLADRFATLLHECGHASFGHIDRPGRRGIDWHRIEIPRGIESVAWDEDAIRSYNATPDELEANSFEQQFLSYSAWKAAQLFGETTVRARLRVLADTQIVHGGKHGI